MRPAANNIARVDITLPYISPPANAFDLAPINNSPNPNVNSILRCYVNSALILDASCYYTKTTGSNPTLVLHITQSTYFLNNADTSITVTTEFAEGYNGILFPTVAGS